ncbi:hypothetical protein GCM10022395_14580 [Snuella lapsa]|uniref:Peptidase S54 rhomboid domain-containing protein n=2 Tax=Snuella lapsa TaxID=870481 RepID=A0ABP6XDU2_9FLAO
MPVEEGISWEGHLSGMITGLLFALIFRKEIAKPKKFDWEHEDYNEEDDPFLKHFDADGNFIETIDEVGVEENQTIVNYTFKIDKENKE